MARWGIEVPSSDDEEEQRTEAALAFDDAEFQSDGPDPDAARANGGVVRSRSGLDPIRRRSFAARARTLTGRTLTGGAPPPRF